MNKTEFNMLLSRIAPLADGAYSQEMLRLFPGRIIPSIRFELCNKEHSVQASSWPDTSALKDGYGGWSWEDIYYRSRFDSKKFVIAVSCNGQLGGIFSGKVSTTDVELQYVQRDSRCRALKGSMIPASITYSAILGLVLTRESLTVCEPAPEIVTRYENSMKGDVIFTYGKKREVTRMSVPVKEVLAPPTGKKEE